MTVAALDVVPAGAQFGIYTYGAAESVNAAEELSVPVVFDPSPGANEPAPPPSDLRWAFAPTFAETVTGGLQGSFAAGNGAGLFGDNSFGFTLTGADIDPSTGYGTVRYRGTILAATRFHLGEIAIADPAIEFTPDGTWLRAGLSTSVTAGPDSLVHSRIARLDAVADPNRRRWTDVPARFEASLVPSVLLPYANSDASPVTFGY